MKGIYILIIELKKAEDILVGRKGFFHFQAGFYGYAGSALSGLEGRLKRHLKTEKKFHWHIDYLLSVAGVRNIIYAETVERKECALARALSRSLTSITGFGCSDCRCPSHLFFCRDRVALERTAGGAFKSLGLAPESYTRSVKMRAADEA